MDLGDVTAIGSVLAMHGHLTDEGAFARYGEVFTPDVVLAHGGGELHGLDACVAAGLALGDRNPVAHHVTNVVVTRLDGDVAEVASKGIGVMTDGTTGSVTYRDVLHRTPDGWRIAHRTIIPRTRPLHS